ncbi:MAG: glycosyl hydrolase 53 family protein [Oscillospiraceae bacterium]|nr:glycosyl hydrolase 53 family protein [Oscillospiraceae bacterium]
MIKGADLSSLLEVERRGGLFRDGGEPLDALDILSRYGIDWVRLRLWNDPFDENGNDYGGGVCDLAAVLTLAGRAKRAGMKWLLDIQYSDFWTDPGCQTLPKAWRGLDEQALENAVYQYTRDVLRSCQTAGAPPDMVQVGNELTGGLLWPTGQVPNWKNICRYLMAGVRAVREEAPQAPVVIHLDHGGKNPLYRHWFDNYFAQGGECDIIGLSFYPCWHGKMEGLAANMNDLALRYGKDLVVIEAGTAFTAESYAAHEGLDEAGRKGPTAGADMAERLEYPMTLQGQTAYIQDLADCIRAVPAGRGKGFFWWEPCWLPVPGSSWAKKSGWEYIGKAGPEGNEWANQTLFDFDGNALPAMAAIRDL